MRKLSVFLIALGLFLFLPARAIAGNAPVQSQSSYTTPSSSAPSDGSSTETFSVHLQDVNNQPVVGDLLSVSSSNDGTATFPQNNQTTDSNGNATFKVATITPGAVKITLYDSTNNVTFTDWFSVTFYSATLGCSSVPAAPVLSSVVSNSDNTATLTWVDSANPVSNYLVSYGVASKSYIYGNPNIGAQGTTSYTVGSLIGGKKYYFAVSANNNCGISGFSNEVSAVAMPLPATPGPTVAPTEVPTVAPLSTPALLVTNITSDTPAPSDTPQPVAADVNTTFRNLGIGIVVAGVLLIGSVFIFQLVKKKKNPIPPIYDNPPPTTFNPPVSGPPTVLPQ